MTNDVQTLVSRAAGLLKSLIAIPSLNREEEQAVDFLQNYIETQGMATGRKDNNIWCPNPMFGLQKPTLLSNSHIDTVGPVDGWRKAPFNAVEENGRVYGLGSNDTGVNVADPLQVPLQLCCTTQAYNLVFPAFCKEEISGKGGIESVLPQLPPIQFAIVGEPIEMQPAIAEKGLMVLDVTAYGRSGHAARNEGDSTIYKVSDGIMQFRDYHLPKESPSLGPVKMSVTIANAGTQYNVVPDRCTLVVGIHSDECYTDQELFDEIRKYISCETKVRSFRLGSSHVPPDHPLARKAVALGRVLFGSPTLSDQALMPFSSMKVGLGKSNRSHIADEFIFVKEIEEAITLYLELLDRAEI